ncbi:Amidohydrolase [Azospirillaceae bacterium]
MIGSCLRIASAQYPIGRFSSWGEWRAKISAWVADAVAMGAQLLLFPEYSSLELASLFVPPVRSDVRRQLDALQDLVPAYLNCHAELAQRHRVYIVAASLPIRFGRGYRNCAYLFSPDGSRATQEKLMMSRSEEEEWGVVPGETIRIFDTALGRFGIALSYDIEFPLIARLQIESGAAFILTPSHTDTPSGYARIRISAQARALENQCVVVHAVTVGRAEWSPAVGVNTGVAAFYLPPDCHLCDDGVLVSGTRDSPQWLYADISPVGLEVVRTEGEVLNHRNWPRQFPLLGRSVEMIKL